MALLLAAPCWAVEVKEADGEPVLIETINPDYFTAHKISLQACHQEITIDAHAIREMTTQQAMQAATLISMSATMGGKTVAMDDEWNCAMAYKLIPQLIKEGKQQ